MENLSRWKTLEYDSTCELRQKMMQTYANIRYDSDTDDIIISYYISLSKKNMFWDHPTSRCTAGKATPWSWRTSSATRGTPPSWQRPSPVCWRRGRGRCRRGRRSTRRGQRDLPWPIGKDRKKTTSEDFNHEMFWGFLLKSCCFLISPNVPFVFEICCFDVFLDIASLKGFGREGLERSWNVFLFFPVHLPSCQCISRLSHAARECVSKFLRVIAAVRTKIWWHNIQSPYLSGLYTATSIYWIHSNWGGSCPTVNW